MLDGKFIDADTHVYEDLRVSSDYIDPQLRARSPRWIDQDGRLMAEIGGKMFPSMPNHPGMATNYGKDSKSDRSGNDPAVRLQRMDATGTHIQVIFPTLGLAGFPGMVD